MLGRFLSNWFIGGHWATYENIHSPAFSKCEPFSQQHLSSCKQNKFKPWKRNDAFWQLSSQAKSICCSINLEMEQISLTDLSWVHNEVLLGGFSRVGSLPRATTRGLDAFQWCIRERRITPRHMWYTVGDLLDNAVSVHSTIDAIRTSLRCFAKLNFAQ